MISLKSVFISLTGTLALSTSAMAIGPSSMIQMVNQRQVQQSVTVSPQNITEGSQVQVSTGVAGAPTGETPSGSVVFSLTPNGTPGTVLSSAPIALQTNGTASWLVAPAVGTYTVASAYSGSANYLSNTATGLSAITVTAAAGFSVTAPTDITITQGATGTANISIMALNGFSGIVKVSCTGLPTQGACSLLPETVTISSQKTSANTSTPIVSTTISINTESTTLASLTFIGLFFGFAGGVQKRMRKTTQYVLLACVGICLASAVTGCVAGKAAYPVQGNVIAVGVYPVTITATSGSITHTTVVNVHVVAK